MKDLNQKKFLKQKYGNEMVLVCLTNQTQDIPDLFNYGITTQIFDNSNTFVFRYDAEYNPVYTQLIPYVIVTNLMEDKLYVTKRIQGDERLTNLISLGAGGHINPQDMSEDTLITAAYREINEELDIVLLNEIKRYGTVRDMKSTTKEHLGLVYIAHANEVSVKEQDILSGQWVDINYLISNYNMLESWAKHITDHIYVNYKKTKKLFRPVLLGEINHDQYNRKKVRTKYEV